MNLVYSIAQDSTGRIWIGTYNEGLYHYDPRSDLFIPYRPDKKYTGFFKNEAVLDLCTAREDEADKHLRKAGEAAREVEKAFDQ